MSNSSYAAAVNAPPKIGQWERDMREVYRQNSRRERLDDPRTTHTCQCIDVEHMKLLQGWGRPETLGKTTWRAVWQDQEGFLWYSGPSQPYKLWPARNNPARRRKPAMTAVAQPRTATVIQHPAGEGLVQRFERIERVVWRIEAKLDRLLRESLR